MRLHIHFGLVTALLLAAAPAAWAQSGTVFGLVFDANTGNPVRQAVITVDGSDVTATTDLDGSYTIELPAGTYTISIVAEKYLPTTLENLEVIAGEVADGSTVMGAENVVTKVEVTATVDAQAATAESMVLERKLASTVSDAISSEEISKAAVSDAAGALQKVTGVSVVGDGFVYVRGLGERYSATMLNNAMITTTEPEKRVVPLDLFPANLIDNIKVVKTYSADLPGEFSGGLVQMKTVEFPTQRILKVSLSTGFNSQTTGKDFQTYPGGGRDFFGFDDGRRQLPSSIPSDQRLFRGAFTDAELIGFANDFDHNWDLTPTDSARPTQSYSIVAGDTFGKLGIIGAVTFSNGLVRRPSIFRSFGISQGTAQEPQTIFDDFRADTESSRLGAIVNLAYRFSPKHKIAVRNTLTHDNDKEGRLITGFNGSRGEPVQQERLRWVERSLFATQIEGEHLTSLWNSVFTWQLGFSQATRDEPDLREIIRVRRADDTFAFSSSPDSGNRFFSDLEDRIWEPTAEWSIPFFSGPVVGSFDVGFRATFRDRDFQSRRFRYILPPRTGIDPTAPGNEIFAPENLVPGKIRFREFTRGTDAYTADLTIYGGYFNFDVALGPKWRLIAGLRVEDFEENVFTIDNNVLGARQVTSGLAGRDPLPAINVVYALTPKQNLRFGWGRTLSRPDFRELSPFNFTEIVGGFSTTGNPNLLRTSIQNFDARWEYFFGGDQLFALSYFRKRFDDPIELVLRPGGNQRQTWINADFADNQGFEIEFRRGLGFLSSKLDGFGLASNFTFVDSNISIPLDAPFAITNFERPLIGQSRYIYNGAFEWAKPKWRSTSRLFVNYFSNRIAEVGADGLQDVIENGRTRVDFVYEYALTDSGDYKIRFNADNLTNANFVWTQGDGTRRRFLQGRTYRIGLTMNIL